MEGEFLVYAGLAIAFLLLTVLTYWFASETAKKASSDRVGEGAGAGPPQRNLRQQAQGQRRAGVRRRGHQVEESDSDGGAEPQRGRGNARDPDSDQEVDERLNDPKLGTKKREKLLAKAEKKVQREAEERAREDKKVKQAKEENERKLREEKEAAAEKKRQEEEERLKKEQAQKELEEYLQMKEAFSIEEEGCQLVEEDEEHNLIEMFVEHIQTRKVVLFEELASKFGLKVPEAIDRLKHLVDAGRLTGVMDDRGKFIYIAEEELVKFAKFVKQRGRVPITELVENSATLINLTPVESKMC